MAAVQNLATMRAAQLRRKQGYRAKAASHPAPVGGWNARDSLADMDVKDAVTLDNWWPNPSDVQVRQGYTQDTTGLPSAVQSLMVYGGPTGEKMFAAAGTAFYNVSAGGAVGAAVVTGLSNAKWEYQNISTSGGNFMLCVNGTDKLRGYNGTTWWTDGDGTHDITGVDTSKISMIMLFKNRIFLLEKNSLRVWFLPINSIAGAVSELDFLSIARFGGAGVSMGTWTLDAGYGADDMFVYVTNQGEIIVYRGIDPSFAATWGLAGVWQVGSPFVTRCLMKYGGDLLILTYDGLFPLAQYLQSSRLDPKIALTDKIYSAISAATSAYGSNFGWDITYFAKANMLLLNIPVSDSTQIQYAMNAITKQWCSFSGVNANCWEIFNDNLYFGGSNFIGKMWNGFTDYPNNATVGVNINANCLTAFSDFGNAGTLKRWMMIRPIFLTNGTPSTNGGMNIDFDLSDNTGALSFAGTSYALWDTATWDTDVWGGALSISKNWQSVNGIGTWAAVRVKVASMGIETHWLSTSYTMEAGAII